MLNDFEVESLFQKSEKEKIIFQDQSYLLSINAQIIEDIIECIDME